MLKLAGTRRVEPEVGLQRDLHTDTRRDIHERAAAPDRAVQSGKLVVSRGHQLHKVGTHHFGIGAVEGTLNIGVNHALCGHLGLDVVVDHFGVILGTHTSQRSPFGLGDAKPLKRVFDVVGHLAPLAPHLSLGADVSDDIAHVQSLDGGAPVLHRHGVVDAQALLAENAHPLGVILFLGNFLDDLRGQAGIDLKGSVGLVLDVVNAAVHLGNVGLFCFKGSHLASSSFSARKPSSIISLTRLPSPVRTIWASSSTWT